MMGLADASVQVIVAFGGFIQAGEKPVSLNIADITVATASYDGVIRAHVSTTEDQLEELPRAEL